MICAGGPFWAVRRFLRSAADFFSAVAPLLPLLARCAGRGGFRRAGLTLAPPFALAGL